jgi:hypothetical protein
MKSIVSAFVLIVFCACSGAKQYDVQEYYKLVKQAEELICHKDYNAAVDKFRIAFKKIAKPFGKDVFNAALASHLANKIQERDSYLQQIINNSDQTSYVKSQFVGSYMFLSEWNNLVKRRKTEYIPELRQEFKEIQARDQLFRPMYGTHDDTISANRIINVNRILELTNSIGFPSHIELGYTNNLRGQNHDIVLHHTSQRRSRDKSIIDLEAILFQAVQGGRFDPETAIFYLNFQNDSEKGRFEVYSTWQYKHPDLPDSLNNKVWLPKLNEKQKREANRKRKKWHANSLEEIAMKAAFVSNSDLPFIFTCVKNSVGNIREDFDKNKALEQYRIPTMGMEEYKQ